ncbi:MAG: hotdog fold thioesterase [Saprospiraceae bacterium]|nr:hotdog fold thioesterase [Saprospiraceae bacterium]
MTEIERLATQAIAKMRLEDNFSKWLKVKVLEAGPGHCVCRMKVRKEMLNGFGILHGGISYSLADSCFAFASNSHGRLSLALKVSMSYAKAVQLGDILTAEATEIVKGQRTGIYQVLVTNEEKETVAVFDGTVYRTDRMVLD